MAKRTCVECVYAGRPPATRCLRDFSTGWAGLLMCVNHPDSPGVLRDVAPSAAACRNFRIRYTPPQRGTPPKPPNDDIRYIALTKGLYAIVDATDFDWLSQFTWHARGSRGRYYAATVINGKSITMHHMIMNPPPGKVTDHHDGNGLNNHRTNLRNCTSQQNRHNTRPRGKTSRFVGVSRWGDKWRAKMKINGKYTLLGTFNTEIEAARARDAAALKHHGPFAWRNLPEEAQGNTS